jgi:hypothetical protein
VIPHVFDLRVTGADQQKGDGLLTLAQQDLSRRRGERAQVGR